jgi:RsiW-degrading membrane proteinase PrsW (M82 family)
MEGLSGTSEYTRAYDREYATSRSVHADLYVFPLGPTIGPETWNHPLTSSLIRLVVAVLLMCAMACATMGASATTLYYLADSRRCFPALHDWGWMFLGHVSALLLLVVLVLSVTRRGSCAYLKGCFFPAVAEQVHVHDDADT